MKKMLTVAALGLATFGMMSVSACGGEDEKKNEGGGKLSVSELIITAIPDSDSKELKKEFKLLGDYLEKKLGVTIKYESVKGYDAAVTALVSNKCHLAWLGGKTAIDAERQMQKSDRAVHFVACRDIDRAFKSYFIANKDVIAKHNLKEGDSSLQQLVGKDLTLTFGSTGSTSGHLMPRFF
ncbi:MAG: PhnD/SsuA/transferrin family substrate-binding protein, partial [Planctomycetes bacterium]|nr:PhnD/SsuA/transferrin family substrate-binding protein [Planctomycetota bacterium]